MHVSYQTGNEHNPTDRFGRVRLELAADGQLRVEHYRWLGGRAVWTAVAPSTIVDRLGAALVKAGFPAAERSVPYPDDRMRRLTVTGAPAGELVLPWDDPAKLPGYADAFELLDGLITVVSGVDMSVSPPDLPVTDIQQLE
jgi:hypothetical protein